MKSFEPTLSPTANKNSQPIEPQIERQFSRETAVKAFKNATEVVRRTDATEKELELAMTELHSQLTFSLQDGNCTELNGVDKKAAQTSVISNGREFAKQNGVTYDEKFDPFVFVPIEEYEHARIGKPGEVRPEASAHYDTTTGDIVVAQLTYIANQRFYPLPTFEYPAVMWHESRHQASWTKYIEPYLRLDYDQREATPVESTTQDKNDTATPDVVVNQNFLNTHRLVPELLMWTDEILAYTVEVQVGGARDFAAQMQMMKDPQRYCMKYAPPNDMEEELVVLLASALEMGMHPDQVMKALVEDVYVKDDIETDGWSWLTDQRKLLRDFTHEIATFGVAAGVLDGNDLLRPNEKMADLAKKYFIKSQIKADIAMASALFALADVYDRSELAKAEMVSMSARENVKDTNYYLRLSNEPANLGFKEYPPHLILQVREPFTFPNDEQVPVEYELTLVGRNRLTGWNESPRRADSYGYTEKDAPMLAEKLYKALQESEKQKLVARCKDSASFLTSPGNVLDYKIGNEFLLLLEKDGYISTEDKDRFLKLRSSEHRINRNNDNKGLLRYHVNMLADPEFRQRKENAEEAKTQSLRLQNEEALVIGILGNYFSRTDFGAESLVRIFIPKPAVIEESKGAESLRKVGNVRLELVQLTEKNVPVKRIDPMDVASEQVVFRVMQVLTDQEKESIAAAVRENRIESEDGNVLNELKKVLAQEGYILDANATIKARVAGAIKRRVGQMLAPLF